MSIEDSWASLDVIFIVFGSKDYLVAAAVLYLYPARHTQAAPVFKGEPIFIALGTRQAAGSRIRVPRGCSPALYCRMVGLTIGSVV